MRRAALVLALVLGGCFAVERDMSIYYAWAKRGQAAGDSLRTFCTQAAAQERRVFSYGFASQAAAITITIDCGHGAAPETIPYK